MRPDRRLFLQPGSGIAGDMFVASLVNLLQEQPGGDEAIEGWKRQLIAFTGSLDKPFAPRVIISAVKRKGMAATHVSFEITQGYSPGPKASRHYQYIRSAIEKSTLAASVKEMTLSVFACLAEAEAKVHGTSIESVHFHEAGSEDAIADVASAAMLFDAIGQPTLYTAPISVAGAGSTRFSHGEVPLPVPAVQELLRGYRIMISDEEKELVTPTGAAILKGLGAIADPMPQDELKTIATGVGAGTRELSTRPNVLRCMLLETP